MTTVRSQPFVDTCRPASPEQPDLYPAAIGFLTHPSPPVSEFVYFLAAEGHLDHLDRDHVQLPAGDCAACGKPWPCNWRRLADQAHQLLA